MVLDMKVLVLYSSRSGNTQKLAEAVYAALEGEKRLISITDLPLESYDYDLIIAGFSIMAGRVEPRMARFLAGFEEKTKILLFMTHGSKRGSALVKKVMKLAVRLVERADVVDCYSCQGEVSPVVLHKLRKASSPPAWLDEGENAQGHPDNGDIEEFVALVKENLYSVQH